MDVKVAAFLEASQSLVELVSLDLAHLAEQLQTPLIVDGLQNGQVQKFEYTIELCWKAMKAHLKAANGIDEASPKKVIKAYYMQGYLTEDDYQVLLAAVDDRNQLSHAYDEHSFKDILLRLPDYASVLKRTAAKLASQPDLN